MRIKRQPQKKSKTTGDRTEEATKVNKPLCSLPSGKNNDVKARQRRKNDRKASRKEMKKYKTQVKKGIYPIQFSLCCYISYSKSRSKRNRVYLSTNNG